jgi:hypothetical protein
MSFMPAGELLTAAEIIDSCESNSSDTPVDESYKHVRCLIDFFAVGVDRGAT